MSKELTRRQLADVIAGLVAKNKDPRKLAREIADYLVHHKQTADLDNILRLVQAQRQNAGIVETDVTTAFPMNAAVKQQVTKLIRQQYPDAKQTILNQEVQPEVLSGLRLRTVDKSLEATARGKLDQLMSSNTAVA